MAIPNRVRERMVGGLKRLVPMVVQRTLISDASQPRAIEKTCCMETTITGGAE